VQVLDDVGLHEPATGARRIVVLVFLQCLVAEVVPVDQEQDATGPGVLEQAPAEGAGGEGLACTGGHLDQGAGLVLGQRRFQAGNGIDLTIAQAIGVQRRHVLQALAQGVRFLEPGVQGLRLVEGEQATGARVRIAGVAKQGLVAGGFIVEDQVIGPTREMLRQLHHVFGGLLGNAAEGHACLLGLDDAGRLAADEQQVVAGAIGQRELAHGHAFAGVAVEVGVVLDDPARCGEQGVDLLSGALFGSGGHARVTMANSPRLTRFGPNLKGYAQGSGGPTRIRTWNQGIMSPLL
jgi:hypothetical protein